MSFCTGQCRYLLCIYRLCQSHPGMRIRCVDIANDLGVTRPSVSKMMKCMVRSELVAPDYTEAVVLTERGREIALQLNRDYNLVYAFFRRILRLPAQKAKAQAFLFLSTFPEETVQRLCSTTSRTLLQGERRQEKKPD